MVSSLDFIKTRLSTQQCASMRPFSSYLSFPPKRLNFAREQKA
jgi:hypothetical protein